MHRNSWNRKLAYIFNCILLVTVLTVVALTASAESGISGTEIAVKMHINSSRAYVNQEAFMLEQPPVISNGRTLIPLRFFSEALGAKVLWNDAEKSILIRNGEQRIRLYVNQKTAFVNDRPFQMDAAPTIANGRTLVPLRFVSQVLGFDVKWDERTQAVTISGVRLGNVSLASATPVPAASDPMVLVSRGAGRTALSQAGFELEVIRLVNVERAKAGLPPVSRCDHLMDVAETKSRDMVDNRYFAHTSPVYGGLQQLLDAHEVTYGTSAENIAAGQKTPQEVMEAWMNSPGHRNNILDPDFVLLGVGTVEGGLYGGFTWTQLFTD